MNLRLPSPIVPLEFPDCDYPGNFYMKREDLIHPEYGGNKWRKLFYNIAELNKRGCTTMATFGGPFSNHIAATAAICRDMNIRSLGFIRGTYHDDQNPTLRKAIKDGMKVYHIDKEQYSLGAAAPDVKAILEQEPGIYVVPEGGRNDEGMKGASHIRQELSRQLTGPLNIFIAAGTGTTAAGMITASQPGDHVYVVNALKNPQLESDITSMCRASAGKWSVLNDYHMGGFAKTSPEGIDLIRSFYSKYGIRLDPIYNIKMISAMLDRLQRHTLDFSQATVAVHTGGMQGITAYNYTRKNSSDLLLF